jgi:hypothetical protein
MTPDDNDGHYLQHANLIIEGPSKLDIMLALFDFHPKGLPEGRSLRFVSVESRGQECLRQFVTFHLLKVERVVDYNYKNDAWVLWGKVNRNDKEYDVKISYRTDTRQGDICKLL